MVSQIQKSICGFWKYLPLLRELVIRDIKVRYRRSFLGLLWTVLNPLLMMSVMTVIFSTLFQSTIENFALYYLAGYILYTFLNESTTSALYSIVDNNALMKKVYIPKYLFPVSKVASSRVNLGFSVIAMLIVMIVTKASFYWTLLAVPLLASYIVIFCCGLGMILATLDVFFRDIGHLYGIVSWLWMYLTPIFYPEELLEQNGLAFLLQVNPLNRYIQYFRTLVLEGAVPGLEENLVCAALAIGMLLIGVLVFYRRQDRFILYV